jgi:hypothetical protein
MICNLFLRRLAFRLAPRCSPTAAPRCPLSAAGAQPWSFPIAQHQEAHDRAYATAPSTAPLSNASSPAPQHEPLKREHLTPAGIVAWLDKYIIGQADAKRAVAVAMRNRWRRHRVPAAAQSEVMPKNILMIGPTGSGKTEVARRIAKLSDSPFVKVRAECGVHGLLACRGARRVWLPVNIAAEGAAGHIAGGGNQVHRARVRWA